MYNVASGAKVLREKKIADFGKKNEKVAKK